jgi:competence protein ComEA
VVIGLGYLLLTALAVVGIIFVANRRPAGQPIALPDPPTPSPLRIHVTGAVTAPGVYYLPPGSIVLDAITEAGGPLAEADQNALNLARLLRDGEQVVVPFKVPAGATPQGQSVGATSAAAPAPGGLINLNTATAAELETLPGIGPTLAQTIVDYRSEHGPFTSVEAIMDVPGIGEGKYSAIKDLVTI